MRPVLIFFGCSWTHGVYINHERLEHWDDAVNEQQANLYSYRSLITSGLQLDQINYSLGGSSNHQQFRFAAEHFLGPNHQLLRRLKLEQAWLRPRYDSIRDQSWPSYDDLGRSPMSDAVLDEIRDQHHCGDFEFLRPDTRQPVVVWFITSTARVEFYNASRHEWQNLMLRGTERSLMREIYFADYYDHDRELERLAQQMVLWNAWFRDHGIRNVWIDTFNHHDYPVAVDNRLDFGTGYSDIMSNLCLISGMTPDPKEAHFSLWQVDGARSEHLIKEQLINPITLHPTQKGHKIIAEQLLLPRLRSWIDSV